MPNKLNIISPNFRDFLLGKNLILAESIKLYGSNSLANGLGKIASIGLNDDSVKDSEDITNDGQLRKSLNTIVNKYQNQDSNSDDLFSVTTVLSPEYYIGSENDNYDKNNANVFLKSKLLRDDSILNNKYRKFGEIIKFSLDDNTKVQYGEINESYLDRNKSILGGKFETAGNVIGSVLRGQGVGFSPDGVEPNFDIRTSLAGRVLTSTGIMNDTPIGQEGVKGLAFAMLNNVSFNAQQEIGGMVNTSILNVIGGGDILVPNNDITVPSNGFGRAADFINRLTGLELPTSLLPDGASIFHFNSKSLVGFDGDNNQILINNTGKGQRNALFQNLNANILNGDNSSLIPFGYAPNYIDIKNNKSGVNNPVIYLTNSDEYEGLKEKGNFSNTNDGNFTWQYDSSIEQETSTEWVNKKSILSKTDELFKRGEIKTMINSISKTSDKFKNDDIQTSVTSDGSISRGNAVIGIGDKTFCRTWTSLDRYNKVGNLQKNSKLINVSEELSKLSVLDDNGFVRISPNTKDSEMKRFMFSLENLAWSDSLPDLRECEIGPGDIDGRRGRIMWFPPYDLNFSDNSSVNWDSTELIGRGEPIYTYNNTERTGTLTFKILTDHSINYNDYNLFKTNNNEQINRFIFGCETLPPSITNNLSSKDKNAIDVSKASKFSPKPRADLTSFNKSFYFYYPNDISNAEETIIYGYESGGTNGIGCVLGEYNKEWCNTSDDALNRDFFTSIDDYISEVIKNESAIIEITGWASSLGYTENNIELSTNRANSLKNYLISQYGLDNSKFGIVGPGVDYVIDVVPGTNQDAIESKNARRCDIRIKNNPEKSKINIAEPSINTNNIEETLPESILNSFYCESSYFEYLENTSKVVYDKITDSISQQIKYFQPSFHSITPEGFNSRMNFLLQCTRQGPTGSGKVSPSNLAFGRPPICILRIGDFYHTKIVIDNVDFSYNDLVWDLNPEGIGLQPMIVDVSINFKFIGGSSLDGPIATLQNAVSFNFFANTEMYDNRADKIRNGELINGSTSEEKITGTDNSIATSKEINDSDQVNINEDELANTETTIIENDEVKLNRLFIIEDETYYDKSLKFLTIKLHAGKGTTSQGFYDVFDISHSGKVIIINNTDKTEQILNIKIELNNSNVRTDDYIYYDLNLLESKIYSFRVEWYGVNSKNNGNIRFI